MIKKFIKGKYYKYTGDTGRVRRHSEEFLTDGGWHKCLDVSAFFKCDAILEGANIGAEFNCYGWLFEDIVERTNAQLELDFNIDVNEHRRERKRGKISIPISRTVAASSASYISEATLEWISTGRYL